MESGFLMKGDFRRPKTHGDAHHPPLANLPHSQILDHPMVINLFVGESLAGEDSQWRSRDWNSLSDPEPSTIPGTPCNRELTACPGRKPSHSPSAKMPPSHDSSSQIRDVIYRHPVSHRSHAMARLLSSQIPDAVGQGSFSKVWIHPPRSDTSSVCQRQTSRDEMCRGPPWVRRHSTDRIC
jgi:hypothetical protein